VGSTDDTFDYTSSVFSYAHCRMIVISWVGRWMGSCGCGTFLTRRLRCGTKSVEPRISSLRLISAWTDVLLWLGHMMADASFTIQRWSWTLVLSVLP